MTTTILAKPALEKANQPITITRGDLNKALFINNGYVFGKGHTYNSDIIETTLNLQGRCVQITANIKTQHGSQTIELGFTQPEDNQLQLSRAKIRKRDLVQNITTAKRLGEVLLCIYKHVRLSADKKWATDFTIKTEAREAAAQQLDTGMLPTIEINGATLKYNAPKMAPDKICKKSCKNCPFFS